jgi:hypothetical protein
MRISGEQLAAMGRTLVIAIAAVGVMAISGCDSASGDGAIYTGVSQVLVSLNVSAGTLSPAFARTVTSYSATVPNSVAVLRVTPCSGGTPSVLLNGAAVKDCVQADPIPLAVGENRITVEVSGVRTYTVVVTREAVGPGW